MIKLTDILDEVKIGKPLRSFKISLDDFKELLIQDAKETAEELEFEDPEEYVEMITNQLKEIPNDENSLVKISEIYEDMAYYSSEFLLILKRLIIK